MNRWLIVFSSFIAQTLQYGIVWTVGMFNIMFLEAFDASHGATALISSLNTATFFLAGPLAGPLVNKYGHRFTSFVGGVLGAAGVALSSLATNVVYLYVTFGLITGLGLGITYVPAISIIGHHFTGKKQEVAFALSMSGVGSGMLIFPFVIQYLSAHYGWRGATLITSAIVLNLCASGLTMKAPTTSTTQTSTTATQTSTTAKTNNNHASSTSNHNQNNDQEGKNLFNLKVFKNMSFCLFVLNNMFFFFGQSIVSVHLPAYALTLGMSTHQASYLVSVIGLVNIAGRFIGGFLSLLSFLSSMNVYVSCMFLCTVVTLFVPLASTPVLIQCYAAVFGVSLGCFCVKLPPVIIQILDTKLLASGYGYMLLFDAAGAFLGPPIAGWLYDASHSYTVSFLLAGGCMLVGVLLMIPAWVMTSSSTCIRPEYRQPVDRIICQSNVAINSPADGGGGATSGANTGSGEERKKLEAMA